MALRLAARGVPLSHFSRGELTAYAMCCWFMMYQFLSLSLRNHKARNVRARIRTGLASSWPLTSNPFEAICLFASLGPSLAADRDANEWMADSVTRELPVVSSGAVFLHLHDSGGPLPSGFEVKALTLPSSIYRNFFQWVSETAFLAEDVEAALGQGQTPFQADACYGVNMNQE